MYSKYKGITDRDYTLTPPPGYDGSRFRRRSDGRDDSFPLYGDNIRSTQGSPQKDPSKCKASTYDYGKDEQDVKSLIKTAIPAPCDEIPIKESPSTHFEKEEHPQIEACASCHNNTLKDSKLLSYLQGIGSEEILLISLILLLAGSKNGIETETILILALLLCIV